LAVDYQCHRQARSAGLRGSFRGFVAGGKDETASGLEALVRSHHRHLPVVNAKVNPDCIRPHVSHY